ncbi:hypothetical protein RA19_05780 [Leisingera sp. ANG-M1]|uniref:hypothetical protein n=1 Tax=Leisingera sp. ANG-M1 TaxID=1577895 RepID=UPI00057DD2F4|nr:hypothetical protein [Leisingera sp. ANG-M1]KIC11547.1 hypothetical protein RA19_05780 [Leisingera sp. ANG-M1]
MSARLSEAALAAHGFDGFEEGLLPVLRQFLLSYEQPDSRAWQHAYAVAAERWGEAVGLPVAQSLMKLVRAVLERREDKFRFIDSLDMEQRGMVTGDEAALLRMLHHMRRDQTAQAREAVADVTCGLMEPHVIRAGLAFASRFSAGQAAGRGEAPRLRVVA